MLRRTQAPRAACSIALVRAVAATRCTQCIPRVSEAVSCTAPDQAQCPSEVAVRSSAPERKAFTGGMLRPAGKCARRVNSSSVERVSDVKIGLDVAMTNVPVPDPPLRGHAVSEGRPRPSSDGGRRNPGVGYAFVFQLCIWVQCFSLFPEERGITQKHPSLTS